MVQIFVGFSDRRSKPEPTGRKETPHESQRDLSGPRDGPRERGAERQYDSNLLTAGRERAPRSKYRRGRGRTRAQRSDRWSGRRPSAERAPSCEIWAAWENADRVMRSGGGPLSAPGDLPHGVQIWIVLEVCETTSRLPPSIIAFMVALTHLSSPSHAALSSALAPPLQTRCLPPSPPLIPSLPLCAQVPEEEHSFARSVHIVHHFGLVSSFALLFCW